MSESIIAIRKSIFKSDLETVISVIKKNVKKINKIVKIMIARQCLENIGHHLFNYP